MSRRNTDFKKRSGAKMGNHSKAGNQGFSAWNYSQARGLLTCRGVITDEVFSSQSGKDSQKCVLDIRWHNSGVKQTETGFYYPDSKVIMIPDWSLMVSFKARGGYFGTSNIRD